METQRIVTKYATAKRSADVLGVPKTRVEKLIRLARSSAEESVIETEKLIGTNTGQKSSSKKGYK